MDKQIGQRYQQLPMAGLEERVHVLEERVTALADVVRVLAHGLEGLPAAKPGHSPAAEAARQAYDLLLLAEPPVRSRDREGGD